MSDFLLQKSIQVVQRSHRIKKKKQSEILKLKRKRELLNSTVLEEQEIEKNLKNLQQLSKGAAVNVSEEVLNRCNNISKEEEICSEETEESTVFTDKDFEDFEKYYLNS